MTPIQKRVQEINARLDELENLQSERPLDEKEQRELASLKSESSILVTRNILSAMPAERKNPMAGLTELARENATNGKKTEFVLKRDIALTTDYTEGGIIPLNVKEVLKPLEEGFILGKVGLPLLTGLKGDYVWPVYEAVEASIVGEGVELGDTKIEFSKLAASYDRIGLAIPVTRETLNNTDGILETVIKEQLPRSLQRLLNKILFTPSQISGSTNLIGPFVEGNYATSVTLSSTPTALELASMKAELLTTGIEAERLCWIMTKGMKAILENTPVNSEGIFKPIVENGMINGVPVYTTNYIDGYIGLGDFTYEPMGLFGEISLTIDPYSLARANAVDFVINANYGCKTLRPEAFALGTISATE